MAVYYASVQNIKLYLLGKLYVMLNPTVCVENATLWCVNMKYD
jgi:hypothetical protein